MIGTRTTTTGREEVTVELGSSSGRELLAFWIAPKNINKAQAVTFVMIALTRWERLSAIGRAEHSLLELFEQVCLEDAEGPFD